MISADRLPLWVMMRSFVLAARSSKVLRTDSYLDKEMWEMSVPV